MIVDCHTHINLPADNSEIAKYAQACEQISACFVLALPGGDRAKTNSLLSDYVAKNDKLVGFATIDPVQDDVSVGEIESATLKQGLKGIVLYCPEDNFHPAHSSAMLLYEAASKLSLPVFFHNSAPLPADAVLDYAQPYLLDEIARTFPELKIIVGRMGLPFIHQTLAVLAKHENVYADLAVDPNKIWQVYNIVANAYEAGVMDKLLFGSGLPVATASSCIETLPGFNKLMAGSFLPTVPRESIRSIVERNTLSLLGF